MLRKRLIISEKAGDCVSSRNVGHRNECDTDVKQVRYVDVVRGEELGAVQRGEHDVGFSTLSVLIHDC